MSKIRHAGSPTAIDLYSGAGGLSEGLLNAGFSVRLAIDNDKWATDTQRTNHAARGVEVATADLASATTLRLVKQRVASFGRPLDLLVGGPPCQGFSTANLQTRTHTNPNNSQIDAFVRYVRQLQPAIFLMENVPGLQLFDNGRFLQRILRMFHNAGYQVDVAVLNAADYGVPQTRQRTFVLGNRVAAVNYFPSPKTPSSQWVTVWEAISDLPSALSDGQNGALRYAAGRPSAYAQQMRNNAATQVLNNEISKNSELILRRYKHIPQGGNWRNIPPHLMRNYSDKSRCHQLIYQRLLADKPATVIANVRKSMLIHPFEDRGLSIREAARLQSFPDTFTFKGGLEAQQQQIANGVPPLLATAVASTILNRMIRSATPFSRMLSIAPDLLPTRGLPKPISRFARRNISYFRGRLSTWAAKHLRQLPWRTTADPFRILVAEVLLQKTTAAQAREAFSTIVSEFTSIESLAQADLKRLKQIIRPIGLPNRAARLKSIAQTVMRDYRGIIPSERKDLASLPGIGPYIAAATACFAHGQAVPIVDTNVVRIFQRFFGLKSKVPRPHSDPLIWRFASILVSRDNPQKYNNALIDLGALVCTHRNPKCELCPLRARCIGRTAQ